MPQLTTPERYCCRPIACSACPYPQPCGPQTLRHNGTTPAPRPATTCYTIAKKHYTKRANANGGGVSEFEWVRDTHYGLYPSNLAAKRAYMEVWKPESAAWPDQMVKAHFDAVARNEKSVRVLSIAAQHA